MCLSPINIKNPTRYISRAGGQRLRMDVPCGRCADCVKNKRLEWYFRTYAEVQSTLAKGGYIMSDTLTYAPEHVPMLSHHINVSQYGIEDMMCFSHSDFRDFLKRLRSYLKYNYGNSDFKYFLTSEYGMDERYTRRPHYHVLFFVTNGVHPLTFSRAISTCWFKGRTEGIVYKPLKHVAYHTYGYDLGFYKHNSNFVAVTRACNYVSKYVTKHTFYAKRLKEKIEALSTIMENEDDIKALSRNLDMFHRQSQGFGLSYIYSDDYRIQEAISNDTLVMYDSDKVVCTIPIPQYYRRHLYYVQKRRADGSYYWEKTDKGIAHDEDVIVRKIDAFSLHLRNRISTYGNESKDMISNYLGSRSIEDLAVYMLYYRGRMRDASCAPDELVNFRSYSYSLTDSEFDLLTWIKFCAATSNVNSLSSIDIYDVDKDSQQVNVDGYLYDYSNFIDLNIINEDTCPEFKHFDKIISVMSANDMKQNSILQQSFDYQEELKEKFKHYAR